MALQPILQFNASDSACRACLMKCNCEHPGYCLSHHRKMTDFQHKQCQTNDNFFAAYQAEFNRKMHQQGFVGLGDILHKVIYYSGAWHINRLYLKLRKHPACGCPKRQQSLNCWSFSILLKIKKTFQKLFDMFRRT